MAEILANYGNVAEIARNHDTQKQQRFCIFIPGLSATKDAMYAKFGIHNALATKYGEENVTTFNSSVSSDKPNPLHFEKIAASIMSYARQGPTDIVMHSLGTTDFVYAKKIIKKIKRNDKNFFDDPQIRANIHFVKIGESGYAKGFRERLCQRF